MSSSGGGGGCYRRDRSSRSHHHQADENWSLRPILDQHIPTQEVSSSASSSEDQTRPHNHQMLGWAPKIRVGRSRSAQKSRKEEEGSSSGLDYGLNFSSESGEVYSEEGNQKAEVTNSNDEVDEDDVVKRLEEIRLSAEEPESSEEHLSTNQQLQEDE